MHQPSVDQLKWFYYIHPVLHRLYAVLCLDISCQLSRLMLFVALQFERTLIVADEDSQVSYLEGCTAPSYDKNQVCNYL